MYVCMYVWMCVYVSMSIIFSSISLYICLPLKSIHLSLAIWLSVYLFYLFIHLSISSIHPFPFLLMKRSLMFERLFASSSSFPHDETLSIYFFPPSPFYPSYPSSLPLPHPFLPSLWSSFFLLHLLCLISFLPSFLPSFPCEAIITNQKTDRVWISCKDR